MGEIEPDAPPAAMPEGSVAYMQRYMQRLRAGTEVPRRPATPPHQPGATLVEEVMAHLAQQSEPARTLEPTQPREAVRRPPASLAQAPVWLVRDAKKRPFYADARIRSGTQGTKEDLAALVTFDEAVEAARRLDMAGVGLALAGVDALRPGGEPFTVLDIDGCFVEDGDGAVRLHPEVAAAVHGHYAEVSPSGRGLHVFVRAACGDGKDTHRQGVNEFGIECFQTKGYVTWSGRPWPKGATGETFTPPGDKLTALIARAGCKSRKQQQPSQCEAHSVPKASVRDLEALLSQLASPWGSTYDEWLHTGMALHFETAGSSEGLQLWDRWSAQPGRGRYTSDGCSKKWQSFKANIDAGYTQTWLRARVRELEGTPAAGLPQTALALDFSKHVDAARTIVDKCYTVACDTAQIARTLHYWQGQWYRWDAFLGSYGPWASDDMEAMVRSHGTSAGRRQVHCAAVREVVRAMQGLCNLSADAMPQHPGWIERRATDRDVRDILPMRNGLLHIPDRRLLPATPRLFNLNALPFDWTTSGAKPTQWLGFLDSIWHDDPQSIDALQEWLGYLLTLDTRQHKALMLVGPPRSGKGTIGRVITQLLGSHSVASPSMSSLSQHFGMEELIGKRCAVISDARLGSQTDITTLTENLLRITGEDAVSVPRKHRLPWTGRLGVRFVVLTNEVPVLRDSAAALVSRFVILRMTKSFNGREEHGLDAKLAAELPAVLAWALDGLERLRTRGRFTQPASAKESLQDMADLASPIKAFIRERCNVGAEYRVKRNDLFAAWSKWCTAEGRDHPGTTARFGRDLHAALPEVRDEQPRTGAARTRYYVGLDLRQDEM
jgi:P4 family phage/plasmid primase-like protien